MPLIVPNPSEIALLSFALGKTVPNDQHLKLFVNDYTPVDTTVAADLTIMSTQGYATIALPKADWTVSTVGDVASASQPQKTWSFNGTGGDTTIYGYFITDSVTGALLWAERFNVPKLVRYNGDQVLITPTITLSKAV